MIEWGPDLGIALNSASTAACSAASFGGGPSYQVPPIQIPAGMYLMSTPMTWNCGRVEGLGQLFRGTVIQWVGAKGASVFNKPNTAQNQSIGMYNLTLQTPSRNGNYPCNWIVDNFQLDNESEITHDRFSNVGNGTGCAAISLPAGWTNAHFDHLRFDDMGAPTILSKPTSGQTQTSWSITDSTEDFVLGAGTQNSTASPSAVFEFDNSVCNCSFGTVTVSGAQRFEGEGPVASNFALIRQDGSIGSMMPEYHLSDTNLRYSYSHGGYELFYFPSASSAGLNGQMRLDNIQTDGNLQAVAIGSASQISIPTTAQNGTGYYINFYGYPTLSAAGYHTATSFCAGVATSSATLTFPLLGGSTSTGSCTQTTSGGYGMVMPTSGTLSNLSVRCNTTGINSSSGVFTIWRAPNGNTTSSATSITVTYGTTTPGTVVQDTTHTQSYSAGDLVSLRFTTQASEPLGTCAVSFEY